MIWLMMACVGGDTGGGGVDCTAIGCSDQVSIELRAQGQLVETFSGTITTDQVAGTSFEVSCPDGGSADFQCGGRQGLVLFTALPELHLDLVDETGTLGFVGWLEPAYETVQPNGPECEPTCAQASTTLQLSPL
jgi:hypothetical protein